MEENKIRELLKNNLNKIIEKDNDKFIIFCNLMKEQKNWESKIDNILSFRIIRSRLNKALNLQLKVINLNKWLTVSWRKSSNKKRKEINPLQSAFRQSVYRQISDWKKRNKLRAFCINCKDPTIKYKSLQVDHKFPTFKELTVNFLDNEKNIPEEFDYHYKCGRKFKKVDNLFKLRWQRFHKKYATLQWLCKSCNLKKNRKQINKTNKINKL